MSDQKTADAAQNEFAAITRIIREFSSMKDRLDKAPLRDLPEAAMLKLLIDSAQYQGSAMRRVFTDIYESHETVGKGIYE